MGGLIETDGTAMLYPIFKVINTTTRIDASNLKGDTEKANLSKFVRQEQTSEGLHL